MAGIITSLAVLGLVILLCGRAGKGGKNAEQPPVTYTTIRCPTCGDEARVHGDMWDCGFCGDCGRLTRK